MLSTSLLTALTVLTLGILVILQSLGTAVSPIIALGLGGLAALALQDPLSNLIAGFLIVVSREFYKGEFVSIGRGNEGYIQDINWRNTTIRNLDNDTVIVPNSTLSTSTITNHYRTTKQMRILVPLRVVPRQRPRACRGGDPGDRKRGNGERRGRRAGVRAVHSLRRLRH